MVLMIKDNSVLFWSDWEYQIYLKVFIKQEFKKKIRHCLFNIICFYSLNKSIINLFSFHKQPVNVLHLIKIKHEI